MTTKSKLKLWIDPETGKKVKEVWKTIPKWAGLYQVSNYGRVRSLSRSFMRQNGRVGRVSGKILKPFHKKGIKSDDGDYLFVHLSFEGRVKTSRIHRLVMLAFKGASELEVDHIDRDRMNNRLDNLRYVTHRQNMLNVDIKKGEESKRSFLKDDTVCAIRKLNEEGVAVKEIASKYSITVAHVHSIVKRKSWRHLEC